MAIVSAPITLSRRTAFACRAPRLVLVLLLFVLPEMAVAKKRPALIVIYNGFGTEHGARVWGRALYDMGLPPAQPGESRWRKLKRSIRELESDEIREVDLTIKVLGKSYSVRTDHEGLFRLNLKGPLPRGTHDVDAAMVHASGFRTEAGRLLIFSAKPGVAVVSDVDDTVLQTGVNEKAAMLRKVLTSNAHDLKTYPQAAALYRIWAARGYPIVFVSGSPINLYSRLASFLSMRGFPTAPLLLKNLGLEKGADSLFDTYGYKLRRISEVRELLPGYKLLLVGDSGEKDPETYREVQRNHRAAVTSIMIHLVSKEPASSPRFIGQVVFTSYGQLGRELFKRSQLSEHEWQGLQASGEGGQ